jgi:osmotically inducible protein OsmC
MALAHALAQAGFPPKEIHTVAHVHLEKGAEGFRISRINLETKTEVPNLDDATFQQHAEQAKANCPVSKLLTGAEITLTAALL